MAELLNSSTITDQLSELPQWSYEDGAISKTWERKGFLGALNVLNAVAFVANEMNHHPQLRLHDYKYLTVTLTTHAAGGVTQADIAVARAIEAATNPSSSI